MLIGREADAMSTCGAVHGDAATSAHTSTGGGELDVAACEDQRSEPPGMIMQCTRIVGTQKTVQVNVEPPIARYQKPPVQIRCIRLPDHLVRASAAQRGQPTVIGGMADGGTHRGFVSPIDACDARTHSMWPRHQRGDVTADRVRHRCAPGLPSSARLPGSLARGVGGIRVGDPSPR